jgi:hypothetical protein
MHYSSIRQYASHMRQRNSRYNKANVSENRHSWQSTRFLKEPETFTSEAVPKSKVILQHPIGCKNEQHSKANVQCSSRTWWSRRLQPTKSGARVLTDFNLVQNTVKWRTLMKTVITHKRRGCLNQLSDYQIFQKDCDLWCYC